MKANLNWSEMSLVERLAVAAAQHDKLIETMNAYALRRPCDLEALLEQYDCSDMKAEVETEVNKLERQLEPVKIGDIIQALDLAFEVDRIVYQEVAAEITKAGPMACHDIEFFDPDGHIHSWKSWIDGGVIVRCKSSEPRIRMSFAKEHVKAYIELNYVDIDWERAWDTVLAEGDFVKDLVDCADEHEMVELIQSYVEFVLEEMGPDWFSTRDWQF